VIFILSIEEFWAKLKLNIMRNRYQHQWISVIPIPFHEILEKVIEELVWF
jgi:hypothetical protein